ncbi:independent transporter protein (mitochondrion) [Nannochloropsis gaditana]|uniref:Independent transporter protein n=1 Tax=Nannochloropsis gaditana TaxID=72520 RepID=K9ZVJ6_9STRA|nr:independent transporter protein [Nannochloropsis gaditana]AFZ64347.1 independent transporter protein [Nannochloropsis gaditana]AGI49044.1 independent transporter protein [Nannochloropsis gaditana]
MIKVTIYFLEIYNRFFILFFTWLFNFIVVYSYKTELVYLLGQHQQNVFPYFISTNLTEIFFVFIKLSFFVSFYCLYPVLLIQLALFLIPALYKYEYTILRNLFIVSVFLYLFTTYFTLEIFLPHCWKFFNSFQLDANKNLVSIHLETRIADYLNFFVETFLLLNIGLHIFLVFILFLNKTTLNFTIKHRKVFYVIFFIFATLITPPDVFSQIVVGLMFLISFEIFLFTLFLTKEYKKGE